MTITVSTYLEVRLYVVVYETRLTVNVNFSMYLEVSSIVQTNTRQSLHSSDRDQVDVNTND